MNSFFLNKYTPLLSLTCILMQTAGIRFFSGIGFLLLMVVILLNVNHIRKVSFKFLIFYSITVFLFIVFQLFKHAAILPTLNTILIITTSSVFCFSYKDKPYEFLNDLYFILKLLTIQAFISIFIFFIFHPFIFSFNIRGMPYLTIGFVFYYFIQDELLRITGLFWEPGCLQLFANLYLFLSIYKGYKVKSLLLPVVVVFFTFSSTGFVLLAINSAYYVFKNISIRRLKISIIVILLSSVFLIPIGYNAVFNKLTINLSGMVRQVNTIAGLKLIINHPIIGVDTNVDALMNNREFNRIEEEFWGANSQMISYNLGVIPGGFSNGFLGFLLNWGLIIGIYFYYLFYKSVFFPDSTFAFYFLFLFIISNMTEALTDTTLFYIFIISNFVFGKRVKSKINNQISDE